MKGGFPPTPRKARTGELTPPGITCWARRKMASDLACFMLDGCDGCSWPGFARHQAAESQAHGDLVQAAVEVAQQAVLQAEVGLCSGEQVLHQTAEAAAAARELHHALGDRAEQEAPQKNPLGQP